MSGPAAGARRVVLATRNAHKVGELRAVLEPLLPGVEVLGVDAFDDVPEVAETGVTFEENALLKARAVAVATGVVAVADDSGIAVDVLGGSPGVFSARWAGRHGDDAANLELLLAQVADVPVQHRSGAFVCAAAVATPAGEEHVVRGELRGRITTAAAGGGGFGYDPIFVPAGSQRTLAEHSAEEKNAISHRGRAFGALAPVLAAVLDGRPIHEATGSEPLV
ncbi:RdgB/HAM1 family non-canonical purine NTP pyrophosphatase [Paenibacillus sp. TRM 82003]|uniref:RdgB/HAM1 family non-canonical purine NTP pyrophosphatase n=1 Tax=Kineococcus sp. TRM81007 TaxID=2925831 RepID=UPI001F571495|nr:RdgB/HAM1 family non-canonical purine NTP pyrophosphatase [Kineococcus sp. TRM81007]MCI2239807.1 RdgB/HAM1 family non-canonical purine NTP pyrophosphatase [Kineococcus sp. TRM81007]MCI3925890.1 RdgB/HAM1 family non-canonical purine NTP pyrophosphatase [Paenibacillus sp. TRM 82003]